jgi:hypothetical protein
MQEEGSRREREWGGETTDIGTQRRDVMARTINSNSQGIVRFLRLKVITVECLGETLLITLRDVGRPILIRAEPFTE